MSVAIEFAPYVPVPVPARPPLTVVPAREAVPGPPPVVPAGPVVPLRAPRDLGYAAPVRLTRRGVVVLAALVVGLGLALVSLARASASAPAAPRQAPHAVTVQSGDTLWSIAAGVAPDRDPRAEVDALQRANRLDGVALVPGQVLRVP